MNSRYSLEPASTIRMAAKRSLRPCGLLRQVPALLLALLFAAGCGQKGPLYLPGDPSEIKTDVPRQDESQTEENDEEEALQDEN